MSQYKATILILLLYFGDSRSDKRSSTKSEEEFQASDEWKEIKEGQKVPSGLHYRINLSTGKKEARRIQQDEPPEEGNGFVMVQKTIQDVDGLEEVLKQVNKQNPEHDMPKKFRSLDEIKQELGEVNLQPRSDVELLQDLFTQYEEVSHVKSRDDGGVTSILKQMTYLGHQIDNGNEFYKMNGFERIIYKELNSTNQQVKLEALKLFSVLAQNNPKVKVHILESGGVTVLLRILSLEKSNSVKKSALTALSCTLRTFPYAQDKFMEMGGLKMFTDLLKTESINLKLKVVTFLNDLIVERQKDTDIENSLYNLSWCSYLNELLHDLIRVNINDFDSIEKCLVAMKGMSEKCSLSYRTGTLMQLREQYRLLSEVNEEEEDAESYFTYLSNLVEELLLESSPDKEEL